MLWRSSSHSPLLLSLPPLTVSRGGMDSLHHVAIFTRACAARGERELLISLYGLAH